MVKATAVAKSAAPTHSKEQLLRSQRYAKRRDLLGALLEDGKWYTLEEVDTDLRGIRTVLAVGNRNGGVVVERDGVSGVRLGHIGDRLALAQGIHKRLQRRNLFVEFRELGLDPVDLLPQIVVVVRAAPCRSTEQGYCQKGK